jgi:hypothetical protein
MGEGGGLGFDGLNILLSLVLGIPNYYKVKRRRGEHASLMLHSFTEQSSLPLANFVGHT